MDTTYEGITIELRLQLSKVDESICRREVDKVTFSRCKLFENAPCIYRRKTVNTLKSKIVSQKCTMPIYVTLVGIRIDRNPENAKHIVSILLTDVGKIICIID